ncbi:MAG: NAD(P)-dependent oxidoreductase [Candidatus Bathyarchaeia archaeon]
MNRERIGVIGLGNMGKPMAMNYLRNNYPVTVYDIRPERIDELAKVGASRARSPKEVAENSDVIVTSLPEPPDVEQVILGENGIIYGASKGCIIIETSTIDPLTIKKIAERACKKEIHILDAPVSGGPEGAKKGTLTIMVGGDKQIFERCKPILEVIGDKIFYVGEVGMGKVFKLAANMVTGINVVGALEALIWGAAAGADPKALHSVLTKTLANSVALEKLIPPIFSGELEPKFALKLASKDLRLALQTAVEKNVPTFLLNTVHSIYEAAKALGLGDKDSVAVIKVLEMLSGINISPKE